SICTCSVDAGRTAAPDHCSAVAWPLVCGKAKAPTKGLSALNSTAFGLAVYASQCGLPTPHARLASGRWSGATGRAFHPQDSAERFPSCFLTSHPPFPSFLSQSHPPKQDVAFAQSAADRHADCNSVESAARVGGFARSV